MISLKNTLVVCVIMILTMASLSYFKEPKEMPLKKPFSAFPNRIDNWTGEVKYFDDQIYEILGVDDSLLFTFTNSEGKTLQLYIGYYRSQVEGDLIHSPKNCMPGAGYDIVKILHEAITFPDNKKKEVNKLFLTSGDKKMVALYWYQSRGRIIASEYMQKILLVYDSITRRRTDGSFVRLTAFAEDDNTDEVVDMLKNFSERLSPILDDFIPS